MNISSLINAVINPSQSRQYCAHSCTVKHQHNYKPPSILPKIPPTPKATESTQVSNSYFTGFGRPSSNITHLKTA